MFVKREPFIPPREFCFGKLPEEFSHIIHLVCALAMTATAMSNMASSVKPLFGIPPSWLGDAALANVPGDGKSAQQLPQSEWQNAINE